MEIGRYYDEMAERCECEVNMKMQGDLHWEIG